MTLSEWQARIESQYQERTLRSRELFREARRFLPGGDTRLGTSFPPHPTYMVRGEGSYLHDVDGNRILDFTNNATTLIHGHSHPEITETIRKQAARGTGWAAPNSYQVELARLLCHRLPSVDRIRFCNSGTEANMQAIKVARAFTGRDVILKMAGAYHGTYEGTEFSRADDGRPLALVTGIPSNEGDNVLVAPFGDEPTARTLMEAHRDRLAAVVVNPVMTQGGLGLPAEEYLQFLRETTRRLGILLIFDEVITFRVSSGGGQEHYGVVPDLTALGKIIGGGLPVGAFGGREDIMALFADGPTPSVSHAGTLNGNPLTSAAGLKAMEMLTPEAFEHLSLLGRSLRDRLRRIVQDLQLPLEVNRIASLVSLDLSAQVRSDPQTGEKGTRIMSLVHLALLNRGIKVYALYALTTVMGEAEIRILSDNLREVLEEARPLFPC
jgi:glutamate-1-semialdehyde 2,1-aminomutase